MEEDSGVCGITSLNPVDVVPPNSGVAELIVDVSPNLNSGAAGAGSATFSVPGLIDSQAAHAVLSAAFVMKHSGQFHDPGAGAEILNGCETCANETGAGAGAGAGGVGVGVDFTIFFFTGFGFIASQAAHAVFSDELVIKQMGQFHEPGAGADTLNGASGDATTVCDGDGDEADGFDDDNDFTSGATIGAGGGDFLGGGSATTAGEQLGDEKGNSFTNAGSLILDTGEDCSARPAASF